MSEPYDTLQMPSLPGVRRDGTVTDADFFNDAQWVRFVRQEGRPRKMGGYQYSSGSLSGPVRGIAPFKKQSLNTVFSFSKWGVEYLTIDSGGIGGIAVPITPAGFTVYDDINWSFDFMYDSASGGNATLLLAMPIRTMKNIDDVTNVNLFVTPIGSPAAMTQVADSNAVGSGGIFVTEPYAVILGNDGNITWSDVNGPQNYGNSAYPVGDAGSARITGTKLVRGMAMRSGNAPGGLVWSLDAVLRMDYVGGQAIFKFSHLTRQSSILSQASVIEYDGTWYWAGIDRFMVCNGSQVMELPNDMNSNWFFDNLNYDQQQKVFAMKVTRWGEIWWHFPFGNSTECNAVVIYNVRLKTWYDVSLSRSAGVMPKSFRYPLMTGTQPNGNVLQTLTISSGVFSVGDVIIGNTSGATGKVLAVYGSGPYTAVVKKTNSFSFSATETISNSTSVLLTMTITAGTVAVGNLIKGGTSGATGTISSWAGAGPYTASVIKNGSTNFAVETYTDTTTGATGNITATATLVGTLTAVRDLYSLYVHEKGFDAVEENSTSAIQAYFETCDFGLPTGGPDPNSVQGKDAWTRIMRVEPDFVQTGQMSVKMISREFAAASDNPNPTTYTFGPTDGKVDMREQGREVRLKFESNVQGGFFEAGVILITSELGDVRA